MKIIPDLFLCGLSVLPFLKPLLFRWTRVASLLTVAAASLLSLFSSCRSEVTKSGLSCGLLVDWLERLDPEVTTLCPDLQQKLLFALNKVS